MVNEVFRHLATILIPNQLWVRTYPATPGSGGLMKLALLLLFIFLAAAIILAGLSAPLGSEGVLSVGRLDACLCMRFSCISLLDWRLTGKERQLITL